MIPYISSTGYPPKTQGIMGHVQVAKSRSFCIGSHRVAPGHLGSNEGRTLSTLCRFTGHYRNMGILPWVSLAGGKRGFTVYLVPRVCHLPAPWSERVHRSSSELLGVEMATSLQIRVHQGRIRGGRRSPSFSDKCKAPLQFFQAHYNVVPG